MSDLKNKVIVVTGGNSGIGKATVIMLLEQGARVMELSRSKLLTDEIQHTNLLSFKADVSIESEVKAAFAKVVEVFGTVDVLINNAGIGLPTPDLAETDLDTFEKMVNTNMRAVFLCNREALKIMKAKQSGHILSVVSMLQILERKFE